MTSSQFIHHLEKLVDELLKGRPNQTEIQSLMQKTGLAYTADPVEQMNAVLSALQECRATAAAGAKSRSAQRSSQSSAPAKKAPTHETNV